MKNNKKIVFGIILSFLIIIAVSTFKIKAEDTSVSQPASTSNYTKEVYNKIPLENESTTSNNGSQTSDTQTKKYDKEVYATLPDLQK